MVMRGIFQRGFAALLALSLACMLTSCLKSSTVVRVRKDGSGEIFARYLFSPKMLELVDRMQMVAARTGEPGAVEMSILQNVETPDPDSLAVDASSFGAGVSYAHHTPLKDAQGWQGYEVVYRFQNIADVKIDSDSVPGQFQAFAAASNKRRAPQKGGEIHFEMIEGKLIVRSTLAEEAAKDFVKKEDAVRLEQKGMKPSDRIRQIAPMAAGMRIGHFVRVDPGIATTDATHQKGNLLVLSDADVGGMLLDPDFLRYVDQSGANPDAMTNQILAEAFREVESVVYETKPEITVQFP